jgi:tetratricopeptide (TPR) repeat protein
MKRMAVWAIGLGLFLATLTHAAMPSTHLTSQPSEDAVPGKVGTVHFEISCAPDVRAEFNRGIALLHSFWHDQAFRAFENVASSDPDCAIAYWAEAISHFHQLLASPTPADIQAGVAELAQADRAREKSPREAAYIEALHRFFDGYRAEDYLRSATAYAGAMATVAKTYPHDLEAQVFYALAILAADTPNDVQLLNPRKAFAILKPLFREHPDHPGIAHYIIHACDNPQMAREGLNAARHYAQIAPQVPHALHMPSHIFARLGLWQDDIDSNLASKAAAEAAGLHHGAENRLHAMEFLEYAYLQTGRFDEAKAIVTEARTVQPTDVDPRYPNMWATVEARYPALLAIETKDWTTAQDLKTIASGGQASQQATLLAQAEAAAYLHDRKAADGTLKQLESVTSAESQASQSAAAIEIHAWVDFTRGNLKEAVTLLQSLADRQAKIGKGEVEIPAREMLGDMLLLNGRPAEALTQYRQSLLTDPNRFNALLGAVQAAVQLGRNRLAGKYYRTLLANCPHADGSAVNELQHAKTMMH